MARDAQTIQAEIDRARDALAAAVDELSIRASPKHLVDQGKRSVRAVLNEPKVKFPLIGIGVLVAVLMVRRLFR
jgi:hypothetical protein